MTRIRESGREGKLPYQADELDCAALCGFENMSHIDDIQMTESSSQ